MKDAEDLLARLGDQAGGGVGARAEGAPGLNANLTPGLYGNLTLGVDGTTVTGVFADSRPGKGTEEAPQFSCSFLLRGTAATDGAGLNSSGAIPVTVWTPGGAHTDGAQTSGTLTVEQGTAKLS